MPYLHPRRRPLRALLLLIIGTFIYILQHQTDSHQGDERHLLTTSQPLTMSVKSLKRVSLGRKGKQQQHQLQLQLNLTAEVEREDIDWGVYKYVQVVRDVQGLCAANMIWEEMEKVGGRAGRIMLHPSSWTSTSNPDSNLEENGNSSSSNSTLTKSSEEEDAATIARLLRDAQTKSYVSLLPYSFPDSLVEPSSSWSSSTTTTNETGRKSKKAAYEELLLATFNLTAYTRLVVLQPTVSIRAQLDELFLTPMREEEVVAMPFVYVGDGKGNNNENTKKENNGEHSFLDDIMLIKPSDRTTAELQAALKGARSLPRPNYEKEDGSIRNCESGNGLLLSKILKPGQITSFQKSSDTSFFVTSNLRYQPPLPPLQYSSFLGRFNPFEKSNLQGILSEKFYTHLFFPDFSSEYQKQQIHDNTIIKSQAERAKNAKLIIFHDPPDFPPPWVKADRDMRNGYMPDCEWMVMGVGGDGGGGAGGIGIGSGRGRGRAFGKFGAMDCRDRQAWFGLYDEYLVRRGDVCGSSFMGNG